jgi:hypothetical protein
MFQKTNQKHQCDILNVIGIVLFAVASQKHKSTKVQKYKSTKVQKYKSTKVQKYKSTKVQVSPYVVSDHQRGNVPQGQIGRETNFQEHQGDLHVFQGQRTDGGLPVQAKGIFVRVQTLNVVLQRSRDRCVHVRLPIQPTPIAPSNV